MLGSVWDRRREESGFTLIEMMVVVLIIGILIAIALPSFLGARSRAENRALEEDLRTGLVAALTVWSSAGSYTGFDPATGKGAEPALNWVDSSPPGPPPVAGDIAIQWAAGPEVLLVGYSRTGTYFCIAQIAPSPATQTGHSVNFSDVDTIAECTNGW